MSITRALVEDDGSAGRDKADKETPPELEGHLQGSEWNNVKRSYVELASAANRLTLGLTDNSQRFVIRDDFAPGKVLFTYTDSDVAFGSHTDVVSDAAGEGYGVRALSATASSRRETGALLAGGDDVTVRTRLRVTSTIADIDAANAGVSEIGASDFGIFLGKIVTSDNVGAVLKSVAGGGAGIELDSGIAMVLDTWYEIEVTVDWQARRASLTVDGGAAVSSNVYFNTPEATEDLGLAYSLDPSAGTATMEIDYIEVEGRRR